MRSQTSKALAAVVLTALAFACHRDQTRGLDATPEAPAQLDFGLLPVGGRKIIALTVGNSGAVQLNFTDSRAEEPFAVAQLPADPVDPGSERNVLVAFSPIAPGEAQGEVMVATTSIVAPQVKVKLKGVAYAPDLSAAPQRLDFGDVNVGEFKMLDLVLTNEAPVPLQPSIEVGQGKDYTVNPTGELGTLGGREQTRVNVTFAPTTAGEQPGALLLTCAVCPTRQIQLTGRGIARPVPTTCTLAASPDRLEYGALDAGQKATKTVQVSSVGTGTCFVSKPYFDPASDPAFKGTFQALELAPGQNATLRVDFEPTSSTPAQVGGQVVLVSNDADHNPLRVYLNGNVNPPPPPPPPPGVLQVTPIALTFNAQAPAAPAAQTLTLRNAGGTAFSWTAADDDAKITLSKASGSLAPGASDTVDVSVAAQAAGGTRSQKITIDAGAVGKVVVPVSIVFTEAPPPPPPAAKLTVAPLVLNFSAEIPGPPPTQSISIGNSGGQALTFTAVSDDPKVTIAPAGGTLAAGASAFGVVAVAAQQFVGTRTQKLTVDAGVAGSAVVTVNIEYKQTVPPPPPPQYGSSVWPKFHHDNGNTGLSQIDTSGNKGTAKKVFLSLPVAARQLSSIWRNGTYQASPSLAADGTVYQIGGDGKVYAVDRSTLKVKWATMVGEPMLASAESDITVVKSGHFFIHAHGAGADTPQFFKILDKATSGEIVWQNTPAGYDANHKRLDGFDSAPAIDYDGNLYLMNEDASKIGTWDQRAVKLVDVDLSPKTANNFTHGAALTVDKLAFWTSGGTLWAIDQKQNKVLWSDGDAARSNASVLTYAKNAPMITSSGKVISAFGWREGTSAATYKFYTRVTAWEAGATKKKVWSALIGPTGATKGIAPKNANVNADEDVRYNLGVTSPAQGPDGTIYIGHADGLYAIEPLKGAIKWGVGAGNVVSSPAVGADGRVYFGSQDGYVYCVKGGNVVWQVKTGQQVNSSPAIGADGTVYAMSDDGSLYAIK